MAVSHTFDPRSRAAWNLASIFISNGLREAQKGGAGLVVVTDMDGTTTHQDGYAFATDAMATRIHPEVVAMLDHIAQIPGCTVVVATGGSAERVKHVFSESGLKSVEAFCGYGRETLTLDSSGELQVTLHPWSELCQPLWETVCSRLAIDLGESFSTDPQAGNVSFFLEPKGTVVSLHSRVRTRQQIARGLSEIDLAQIVEDFVASNPDLPADFRDALQSGLVVEPEHNALVELKVPIQIDKATVLREVVARHEQLHGGSQKPVIVVAADDEGDKPMLEACDQFQDNGYKTVKIVIDNPAHESHEKWQGTDQSVIALGDVVLAKSYNSLPQQKLAGLFARSLELAQKHHEVERGQGLGHEL